MELELAHGDDDDVERKRRRRRRLVFSSSFSMQSFSVTLSRALLSLFYRSIEYNHEERTSLVAWQSKETAV